MICQGMEPEQREGQASKREVTESDPARVVVVGRREHHAVGLGP